MVSCIWKASNDGSVALVADSREMSGMGRSDMHVGLMFSLVSGITRQQCERFVFWAVVSA